MIIRIDQRGTQYFVYRENQKDPILIGQWFQKWRKTSAEFSDNNHIDKVLIESNFKFAFWKKTYSIIIPELDIVSKLKPIKIFKGHWRLETLSNIYDYYIQSGHKKSLYKNGIQIASYDKQYFHFFERDTMFISANNDEPVALLISFPIAFDLGSSNDSATMTFDFGNIGKGAIPIDMNWKPQ